jgi:hypothetical protein
MITLYVKDLSKGKKILKLIQIKNYRLYLIRTHPELNIFQNILLNCGLFFIKEKKE